MKKWLTVLLDPMKDNRESFYRKRAETLLEEKLMQSRGNIARALRRQKAVDEKAEIE